MTNETTSTPTTEQVEAAKQRQADYLNLLATHPLALRSWFEPGVGFTIGLGTRADETSSPDKMIGSAIFEDLAVAERDLESVLAHVRASIHTIIANNNFVAGRNSVMQELKNTKESESSGEQSLSANDDSTTSADEDEQLIDLTGDAKFDA